MHWSITLNAVSKKMEAVSKRRISVSNLRGPLFRNANSCFETLFRNDISDMRTIGTGVQRGTEVKAIALADFIQEREP
jgi:hypothetical protein